MYRNYPLIDGDTRSTREIIQSRRREECSQPPWRIGHLYRPRVAAVCINAAARYLFGMREQLPVAGSAVDTPPASELRMQGNAGHASVWANRTYRRIKTYLLTHRTPIVTSLFFRALSRFERALSSRQMRAADDSADQAWSRSYLEA